MKKLLTTFFKKVEYIRDISFLVIHHTEAKTVSEAKDLYDKYEVSVHYLIDESGDIYSLVDERDIAYHAGVSYWRGVDGLNASSIGIELICRDAFNSGYRDKQMDKLVRLLKNLKSKYNIKVENIVGHSDIAYFEESGLLDRKQDPSHLFDWNRLFTEELSIDPKVFDDLVDLVGAFSYGVKDERILAFKKRLKEFGYKVENINDTFDDEMKGLLGVFERRFVRMS
ncbi:MAG: N-acetylmuramoyl-L-alanine amidase [Rickettsiales bacterium]|nr:N-acetylmuramoyl-L-alanine amidase [Rickettsiales bacterium]